MNTKNKTIKKQTKKQDGIFVYRQNNQFHSEPESVIKTWSLSKALLAGKETYQTLKKALTDEIRGWGIKTVYIEKQKKDVDKVTALKAFLDKLHEVYPNILLEIIGKKNLS